MRHAENFIIGFFVGMLLCSIGVFVFQVLNEIVTLILG